MKIIEKSKEFAKYWWFRYTMVTELYIVERWESAIFRKYSANLSFDCVSKAKTAQTKYL